MRMIACCVVLSLLPVLGEVPLDKVGLMAEAQHPGAPAQTRSYGRLVGNWSFDLEVLDEQGQVTATYKGEWNWFYILDGHAIQDVFILPPRDRPAGANGRFYGSAMRVFNSRTNRWESAWIDTSERVVTRSEAVVENGNIVLYQKDADKTTRITYFDISEDSFSWKQEVSTDKGKTWRTTQRLVAKPLMKHQ